MGSLSPSPTPSHKPSFPQYSLAQIRRSTSPTYHKDLPSISSHFGSPNLHPLPHVSAPISMSPLLSPQLTNNITTSTPATSIAAAPLPPINTDNVGARGSNNSLKSLSDHRRVRSNTSPPIPATSSRGRNEIHIHHHHQQQQQQQQQQHSSSATATTPIRHRRESTRRVCWVVWGQDGFVRGESGVSHCRVCGKDYSKGSSTGTLKRHYETHQPGGSHHTYPYPAQSPSRQAQHHHSYHPNQQQQQQQQQHSISRPWSPNIHQHRNLHQIKIEPGAVVMAPSSSTPASPQRYRGPAISEPTAVSNNSFLSKMLTEPLHQTESQFGSNNRALPLPQITASRQPPLSSSPPAFLSPQCKNLYLHQTLSLATLHSLVTTNATTINTTFTLLPHRFPPLPPHFPLCPLTPHILRLFVPLPQCLCFLVSIIPCKFSLP